MNIQNPVGIKAVRNCDSQKHAPTEINKTIQIN